MKRKRVLTGLLAAVACSGLCVMQVTHAQSAPVSEGAEGWAFKLPEKKVVHFKGAQNLEGAAGSTGSLLYAAPTAAGVVAQMIVHGLFTSAQRSREASEAEKTANLVLKPHLPVLEVFTHEELYALAEPKMRIGQARSIPLEHTPDANEWMHASEPIFSLAQDQGAIILDSAFAVYAPDMPSKPVLQSSVRVVSSPLEADQPEAHWKSENGKRIKSFSAQLYAHAVLLSRAEAAAIASGEDADKRPFRTVRYLMGKTERAERAQILDEACGRLLLRTLRGGLLSVPVKIEPGSTEAVQACPAEKTWIALANPQTVVK